MPIWVDVLDTIGLVLVLAVLYAIALMVRRRLIARHGGTFELSHLLATRGEASRWVLGIGRYSGEELEWFRIFSLSPRPRERWSRSGLSYESVRPPLDDERDVLYPDHVVVTCGTSGSAGPGRATAQFAMSRASLTGFQAWLESRSPGTDWTA